MYVIGITYVLPDYITFTYKLGRWSKTSFGFAPGCHSERWEEYLHLDAEKNEDSQITLLLYEDNSKSPIKC